MSRVENTRARMCVPKDYLYSSARNYAGRESRMKIISIFDGSII